MVWKPFFDELYEESKAAPTFCPFQFHPYISSRPGRARALKEIIQYMKQREGVWFATGTEVAEWWLKREFSGAQAHEPHNRAAGGA